MELEPKHQWGREGKLKLAMRQTATQTSYTQQDRMNALAGRLDVAERRCHQEKLPLLNGPKTP